MKNIIKLIAILAMCFMVVGMLASCNKKEQPVDNNDDNQTSTEPFIWVEYEDGTKELYVNGEATGIFQNENNETECPDGKHDFTLVCEHLEHEEDENKYDVRIYKCVEEKCGYVEIDSKGHDYVHVPAKDVAVGCKNDGYEHHECRCGDWKKVNVETAHGHSYDAFDPKNLEASIADGWEFVPKAVPGVCECSIPAVYSNVCEFCGEKEFATGEKINHNGFKGETYVEASRDVDVAPPCEWVPFEFAACSICGCKECTNEVPIEGAEIAQHQYGDWYVVTPATINSAGEIARKCEVKYGKDGDKVCGHIETAKLPAWNENDYEFTKAKPTCTTTDVDTYVYYKDDQKVVTYTSDPSDLGGHSIKDCEATVVTAPTTTAEGKATVKCNTCGETLTFTLPKLPTLSNHFTTGKYGEYQVTAGTCDNPVDTYEFVLKDGVSNIYVQTGESVVVKIVDKESTLHPHELIDYDKETFDGCYVVTNKEGDVCYVAWCEECEQFIVVGYVGKENNN